MMIQCEDGTVFATYDDYLKSSQWQKKRSERLKIDKMRCQLCGRPMDLQVHHLTYASIGHENVYRDLLTLCKYCHEEVEQNKKTRRIPVSPYSYAYRRQLAKQFAIEHQQDDLSNVGIGKVDFCNLEEIKAHFFPYLIEHGYKGELGNTTIIIDFFRIKRYAKILEMIEHHFPEDEIYKRTLFSKSMIRKVCANPSAYERLIKNNSYMED